MGSLNSLGLRFEEAREFLEELRAQADPDHRVAIAIRSEWPDDLIVRLAHLRKEMAFDYEGKARNLGVLDFIWATDFLDHLDTLGLGLENKRYISNDPEDDEDSRPVH